eukprot:TRINITY_DN23054_c1_g1_i1.p1 TRINITY_DN23054_c1_g1~~TRINITY_DN23054_c1_g1_i1.p1  ORF type:complete len:541 (-),score=123.32 TRINITY_DN23054_c1_g1_i1:260-1882(-)
MAPVDEQEQQQAAADLARELASLTCSGVEVVNRAELGGGCVEARRHFRAGERVFLERALVVAKGHTNLARLRAYCGLQPEVQAELRETFWAEEPGIRCAATAACRPDSAGSGDSSAEVLAQLRTEGYEKLTLEEVETVIRVWNLNAYDCALASLACKVSHSCDPNVVMRVDADAGVIEATACRPIKEGEQIGTWYFQDTGLWWMGADIRSSIFKSDRGFRCGCQRCQGTDVCRALPCESCNKGTCVPEGVPEAGKEACNWYCSDCGRRGAGNALRLKAEAELAPRVLMELRPPRNMPKSSPEDLVALDRDATARLGSGHWVAAAAALVLHFRARSGGNLDAFTVACGCRFLGWLMSRSLPLPPASVVRTPISVAIDCAAWLGPVPAANNAQTAGFASRSDRRSVAARLVSEYLLPIFDASGSAIAKVANTGNRVEALRRWRADLGRCCGREGCDRALIAAGKGSGEAGGPGPGEYVSMMCGRCRTVCYCSKECQQADWKARHKGCVKLSEPLGSQAVWELLLDTQCTPCAKAQGVAAPAA